MFFKTLTKLFILVYSNRPHFKVNIQVNIHKAAGPDELPGRVLRACWQVSSLTFSLTESVIPTFQADHNSPCAQERQGNLPK